jgi:hypothetical protein
MKRAKQHPPRFKPRNPAALDPLMKKGGPHARKDKRANRARQKALARKESAQD